MGHASGVVLGELRLTCRPSRENMNIVSRMRKTRLDMCGMARINVERILYNPFHERMSLRMRKTRSIRSIRRKESFTPLPDASAVATISMIDIVTIEPSSTFQPSDQ